MAENLVPVPICWMCGRPIYTFMKEVAWSGKLSVGPKAQSYILCSNCIKSHRVKQKLPYISYNVIKKLNEWSAMQKGGVVNE